MNTVRLHVHSPFQGATDVEFSVHPTHEDDVRRYFTRRRQHVQRLLPISIGITSLLPLVALVGTSLPAAGPVWRTLSALVLLAYGGALCYIGRQMAVHPSAFSTSDLISWVGVRRATRLVHPVGSTVLGIIGVGFGLWAVGAIGL
jgi:hypothetical protein